MSPAEILRGAANVIRRNGLAKGDYWEAEPGKDRRDCPVCLYGAIRVAAGLEPAHLNSSGGKPAAEAWEATEALRKHFPGRHLSMWNDAPERTAEEVIAALEEVAASLSP